MLWIGPLIFFAGLWGQLSSERMTLDQKSKRYTRREGQGPFKRITRGDFSDLDAVVLIAEQESLKLYDHQPVTYRLLLHWKGKKEPSLVMQQETISLSTGSPINSGNIRLLGQGQFYARFIGVPLYDNSYYHSPEPLKPI